MKSVLTSEAKQEFEQRKRAYQLAFGSVAGKTVLDHWATFCRAKETSIVIGDPYLTHVFEGRRQTYLLAQDYLDLTVDQLIEKYTVPPDQRPAK